MSKRMSRVVCISIMLFVVFGMVFANPAVIKAAEKELHEQLYNSYMNPSAEVTFVKSFAGSSAGDDYKMTIGNFADPVCLNIQVTAGETDGNYGIQGSLEKDDTKSYSLPHTWKLPLKERAQYLHIKIGKNIPTGANATYRFSVRMIAQDECVHEKGAGTALKKTAKEHTMSYECKWCGKKDIATATGAHTFKPTGESYSKTTHRIECTECGYGKSENCKFNKIKYKKYNGNCHKKELTCAGCGNVKSFQYAAHKVSGGKCKYCSAKVILPGATKITGITQHIPYTKQTKAKGHWAGKVWIPSTTATSYFYPMTVKYTKAKNAKKYIISLKKPSKTLTGTTGLSVSKKAYFKFKNPTKGVKTKKLTIYVTPVSRTGTYGKSAQKIIYVAQP